jgi:hypothetical protein
MVQFNFGGILHVKTTLDDPDRIHYGTEDVVTGNIVLRYEPQVRGDEAELLGSLDLQVVLQGHLKAVHQKGSREETNLFYKTSKVHDGLFRASPGVEYEFAFLVAYPELADRRETSSLTNIRLDADGTWKYDKRVTEAVVEDLPPTISSRMSKGASLMGPGAESPSFHPC